MGHSSDVRSVTAPEGEEAFSIRDPDLASWLPIWRGSWVAPSSQAASGFRAGSAVPVGRMALPIRGPEN